MIRIPPFRFAHRMFALPLAPLCIAVLPAQAQEAGPRLSIDGSTRVRVETIGGQFRPDAPASDSFVSFRTIVAARLDLGPVTLGGEVVDARGYGEDERSSVRTGEINALEPVQAYLAVRPGAVGTLTLGKFSMDIGSSRLVGRTDFPNGVPTYAGAMLDWRSKGKDRIVLFWTRPFTALPDAPADIHDNKVELDRASDNIQFFGGSGTLAKAFGGPSLEVYGYRLLERDRTTHPTRNRRLATIGARLRQAPAKGRFDYEIEGAYQGGRARATAAATDLRDLKVRAGFVHAEAGWTFASPWAPRVAALFDYASGDGRDSGTYGRFDTLYGSRRGDFGPLSLYGPLGRANIVSPGVRFEARPSKRLDLMASIRGAWLAEAADAFASTGVRDRNGASGRFAGTQVELRGRRWLLQDVLRLEIGAAYLAKGGFLHDAPNAPATGDTRYVHGDLSFNF